LRPAGNPPPPRQPRILNPGDDLLRVHEEGLGQGRVAALGDVVPDLQRVNPPVVAEHDPVLLGVKRDFLVVDFFLLGAGIGVAKPLDQITFGQGGLHDLGRVLVRLLAADPLVKDTLRVYRHQRPVLAKPVAAGELQLHFRLQPVLRHGLG
jgi:hypothetical protein